MLVHLPPFLPFGDGYFVIRSLSCDRMDEYY